MKKEEIHFTNLNRWLFGQTPPEFMIEVFLRTVLVFLFLLLVVRLMGKRMSGQITLTELAVMVTLGAIVSPAMQLPDRGILFAILVLVCALIFQRGINLLGFEKEKAEHLVQGKLSILVKDGVLQVDELKRTLITRQQLFSMLREKQIMNLGKVKRVYLEACGILSIYESTEVKAGLPLVPNADEQLHDVHHKLDDSVMACCNCGHVQHMLQPGNRCTVCKGTDWSNAYLM